MLCFNHVSFAYPGERTILNDLSFSVSEGEQVGLIGANGAGKSTLMKAALGLITVSGTITIDGLEMNRDNLADIRRRLGYVLQDSDNQMFMPTVFEDMLFGLLKRGLASTLKELLMSAEYIMAGGNEQVILCERGIRTFDDYTRNTLDLAAVPMLKELTHLPIIVDPSHATGIARLVEPMALAATACGADGLIIEVHNDPMHALCDGAQSLRPEVYDDLAKKVRSVREVIAK